MDGGMNTKAQPRQKRKQGRAVGYLRRWSDAPVDDETARTLEVAGCVIVFEDVLEDQHSPVNALEKAIATLKPGDVLITPSLEHFARSLRQLDERLEQIADRGASLRALAEKVCTEAREPTGFREAITMLRQFEDNVVGDRTRRSLLRAAAEGRRGGRQRLLTDEKLLEVKRLLKEPDMTVAEIAEAVGVSAATIYRHIPAPRGQRPTS